MADFNKCVLFVLKHETYLNAKGELVTRFEDPETGEKSNYGITSWTLKVIAYKIQDPFLLQMSDVLSIYRIYYWNPSHLDAISSDLVAQKILDMIVNMSTMAAAKQVQAALNSKGYACVIDGIIGPHTLIVINGMLIDKPEIDFLEELRLQSNGYYKIIAVGPKAKFLPTWQARADDLGINVNYKALEMEGL